MRTTDRLGQMRNCRRFMLFIGVIALTLGSAAPPIQAQVLDALAERLVDEVNRRILKTEVDANTRQLQVAATKALVRGSEKDWQELMGSALAVTGTSAPSPRSGSGGPSSGSAQSASLRYRQVVETHVRVPLAPKLAPPPTKPTFLNLAVGGQPLEIAVSPWSGIQRKALVSGVATIEADGNRTTREYVLLLELEPASAVPDHVGVGGGHWRKAMGGRLALVSTNTRQVDVDNEANAYLVEGGFGLYPGIAANFSTIYVYDWDDDGIDECVYLSNTMGQGQWNYVNILRKVQPSAPYKRVYSQNIADFGGAMREVKQSERHLVQRTGVIVDAAGITIREWVRPWQNGPGIKTHRITFVRGRLNPSVTTGSLER